MSTAKKDFERFVHWIHSPERNVAASVKQLTNLILEHFDEISATSRQHSQRSGLIADIARQQLADTPSALPHLDQDQGGINWPWTRLRSLQVGPFRGFRYPEPFDLSKRVVLLYGPNGSGKSSFCEALEYALLGAVEEADARRIPSEQYLANSHEGRFDPPQLEASDIEGNELIIAPNSELYRFCFIEKNRIDTFSRMAAKPAGQRRELIATLFGLEQFNDFANNFNDSIDAKLHFSSEKRDLLRQKQTALESDNSLLAGYADATHALDVEEADLAREYSEETSFEYLCGLVGINTEQSRIDELNRIIDEVPPELYGATPETLRHRINQVESKFDELARVDSQLSERVVQISFKDLFTAVAELESTSPDSCPACDTPLEGDITVSNNPYSKAKEGLADLQALSLLQEERAGTKDAFEVALQDLTNELSIVQRYLSENGEGDAPLGKFISSIDKANAAEWWIDVCTVEKNQDGVIGPLAEAIETAERIVKDDEAAHAILQGRNAIIAERNRLMEYLPRVSSQTYKRRQLGAEYDAANQRIADFNNQNALLISEANEEQQNHDFDIPIKYAYDEFTRLLGIYRLHLPGTLMAGLNHNAGALYNEFNESDRDEDKIESLFLPLTGGQKIDVSFRGNPEERVDALHVLSEGHIRCLGLAILLAKNIEIESPLVIFDDAINAIDHDHRRGIRETLFEGNRFEDCQLVITCHSNEFIKDIQQSLSPATRGDSMTFLLRHHEGDHQPRVNRNIDTRSYVQKARIAKNELNDRDALGASRQALEMQAEKIWRWLGSHNLGSLKLIIHGFGTDPNLRNLLESLRVKLRNSDTFDHVNKVPLVGHLETLLGIPEANLVWTYLNKGTHEEADRDDFDANIVETVVGTIEEIDTLDLRRGG